MKKIIFIVFLIGFGLFLFQGEKEVMIPEEAIRFRVIANSNSKEDIATKELVRRTLQEQVTTYLKDTSNVEEARKVLEENVPVFQEVVSETLQSNGTSIPFKIHYGMNLFPEKIYNGITYKKGFYESLVVTLGKGQGNNWWCVLFPPICLLEAEEEEKGEVEYKFLIKEMLDQFF